MSRDAKIRALTVFLFPDGNETLSAFVPFLYEAGYEDADFILSLKPDEWDVMLDSMVQDAKARGVDIKPGHRMHFKKRLRDMQVAAETELTPRTPRKSAQLQQGEFNDGGDDRDRNREYDDEPASVGGPARKLSINTSPQPTRSASRRPLDDGAERRRGVADDDDDDDADGDGRRTVGVDGDSGSPSVSICCDGLRCLNVHWMVCFGSAMCTLGTALGLLVLVNNISSTATAAATTQNATSGGWVFARTFMIIFFVLASFACCGCLLTFCKEANPKHRRAFANCCPDPERCACPTLPVCPSCTACFDLEACCRSACPASSGPSSCDVGCPGFDCKAPDCDCGSFCPSCPKATGPSFLPTCDDVTAMFRKCYNLLACRCKCNCDIHD